MSGLAIGIKLIIYELWDSLCQIDVIRPNRKNYDIIRKALLKWNNYEYWGS